MGKLRSRKCKDCGKKVLKGRRFCDDCLARRSSEKIIEKIKSGVEPVSRAVVRRERRKLLNRRKKRYNIHQIQNLSPEKFAQAVSQCLQNEAVLVGIKGK